MEVLKSATRFLGRKALVGPRGNSAKYDDLLKGAEAVAAALRKVPSFASFGSSVHVGPRVAVLTPPGLEHVVGTWGTWLAGGIVVPLSLSHPPKEVQYMLQDSGASVLMTTEENVPTLLPVADAADAALQLLPADPAGVPGVDWGAAGRADGFWPEGIDRPAWVQGPGDGALIIYTSGTTGRPKGALHTHGSIGAQVGGLCGAWCWQEEDRILHALPLHHIHGLVNALYCAHAAGACVEFLPKFSPTKVWEHLMREEEAVTVFMGVPTMYSHLLSVYKDMPPERQRRAREAAARLRLAVSGSAACPLSVMHAWRDISGQTLLERYGSTEVGMALSNPLSGERRPGSVGTPLPGVDVKSADDGSGELLVRGGNLFREYWGKLDETAAAFDASGWFKTGDTAACEGDPPYWRILGRTSIDIIKCGGYKVSALDMENTLLQHPAIAECAIVGIPDETQGQVIAAVVALHEGESLGEAELQEWAAGELPPYQVPKLVRFVGAVPRNAMGKVNKKDLLHAMFAKQP